MKNGVNRSISTENMSHEKTRPYFHLTFHEILVV